MQKPSIGRIVHYTLTEQDAAAINRRRGDTNRNLAKHREDASGSQVHFGNPVREGETYPLIITRVWNVDPGTINGQVLLDGNDSLWVTSRTPGDVPGSYAWPTRD